MSIIYAVTTEGRLSGGSIDPADIPKGTETIFTFDTPEQANSNAQERADEHGVPFQVYVVTSTTSVYHPRKKA